MTRLQLDTGAPVEVFYPVDRGAVPADATAYAYTPEEVWGSLVGLFPPGFLTPVEVPDAWVEAPASTATPFPLVVFSHGWGTTRHDHSFHNAHLASWGFVVAAPQHPSRDLQARLAASPEDSLPPSDVATIADTIGLLQAENARSGGPLEGRITADDVAVEGHSSGGRDAALAAYGEQVDTWISLAGVPPVPDNAIAPGLPFTTRAGFDQAAYFAATAPPEKPSMLIVASDDIVIPPTTARPVYEWLPAPKRFVVLADTGHVVFENACAGIQQQPDLMQTAADALGLDRASPEMRLAEDGCLPENAPAGDVAAVWNHLAVAQLNRVFDIDGEVAAASLQADYLSTTFPDRIAEYLVEE